MQNLIFSLNATLPVFLTMVAGWLLRQWGFLPKEFCKAADRLTFKITLPIMLFLDMSAVNILHDFQPEFVLFCFAATLAGILVIWGAAHVLIRDKSIVGEFVQAVGLAAVFVPVAVVLGFRNEELIALLIMLGSPTTPSSYVMAKNMGHEGVLTSSCIATTTLLSALTLTGWIFLLRSGGYL